MTTTPPPPTRVRTPPTPLHGPKHDSFEPYSPRRSSRINSKLNQKYASPAAASSTLQKRPTIKRTSSQHFSPPSSPISPAADDAATPARRRQKIPNRFDVRPDLNSADHDSDLDLSEPPARSLNGNRPGLFGMLPTPAKTPKKRALHDETQLKSTARVLFPSRPATVEEVMPSPRKSRKGKHAGFTLDNLDGDAQDDGMITIYTDSKERIPEEDEGEDNPFLVRRRGRKAAPTADTLSVKRTRTKTKHGMSKEVDEAVERGEGMVYVFRGKKMFRRFDDANNVVEGEAEESQETAQDDSDIIHRAAGVSASKPLKRTSLKPRLLFPPKEATPDPDHEDEDEEATTDIEGHVQASDAEHVVTPSKQSFRPATPPTTGRKRKTHDDPVARRPVSDTERDELDDYPMGLDGTNDYLRLPQFGARKGRGSLFDTWPRTKPGVAGASSEPSSARAVSAKRHAEALEHNGDADAAGEGGAGRGKRSRSGAA